MPNDTTYMRLALKLAANGGGWAAPNPLVGSVVVKNGRVIGMGWHQRCGQAHAERNALANCTEDTAGATLYVTLEPCCHHGLQPPCTDAIIAAKIKRVVIGLTDPNPLVNGGSLKILQNAGIAVTTGVLADECARQNRVFCHYITHKMPYVTLKYAMSADGKIAAYTGASQWITGPAARHHVQIQRSVHQAIMVGVGTVLADDPRLTCRLKGQPTPLRIICDSHLRTPLGAKVVQTANTVPTLIATLQTDAQRLQPYIAAGCHICSLPPDALGHVDLTELMRRLAANRISSVLAEGGAELAWSLLHNGLVQHVQAYTAPLLLGGSTAKSPVGGRGFCSPNAAVQLSNIKLSRIGNDFLLEGDIESEVPPCSPALSKK